MIWCQGTRGSVRKIVTFVGDLNRIHDALRDALQDSTNTYYQQVCVRGNINVIAEGNH